MLKYQNFMKIRPVGSELSHADGRTGRRDEGNSRFSQFYKHFSRVLVEPRKVCGKQQIFHILGKLSHRNIDFMANLP